MLPSTAKIPMDIKNGGIEYRGYVYLNNEKNDLPLNNKELWFAAKNDNVENNDYLAKIWETKKNLGCSYTEEIETIIKESEKKLSVIKIASNR